MNDQEAFDKVARHLLKQNRKAISREGEYNEMCMYRTAEDLMCAVGCLIPDEDYDAQLEGNAIEFVRDAVPCLGELSLQLLETLQSVHDDEHPTDWHDSLTGVAANFDLTMPRGI